MYYDLFIYLFGAEIADRDDKMKWKSLQNCNMYNDLLK